VSFLLSLSRGEECLDPLPVVEDDFEDWTGDDGTALTEFAKLIWMARECPELSAAAMRKNKVRLFSWQSKRGN
jgi:hypothetical protein